MIDKFIQTHHFLVVFLAPIIPAALVAFILGTIHRSREAGGSFFGGRFHTSAGVASYVLLAILAYGEFGTTRSKVETYELALTLQGAPSAIEKVLKDLDDFRVVFRSKEHPGEVVYFSNFSVHNFGTQIRSKIAPSSPIVIDHFSEVTIYPQRTEAIALELIPKNLKLSALMEATLHLESVARGSGERSEGVAESAPGINN
jgi:hypothetical protein